MPAPAPALLGLFKTSLPYIQMIATEAAKRIPPAMLQEPMVYARRVADLIVWDGPSGTRVLAALEGLNESQQRIQTAVTGIETAQFAMKGTLECVQTLSMATFGLASFSSAFMLWRLQALNSRLDQLSIRISDIKTQIDAQHQGLLDSSLNYLHEFEERHRASDLDHALERARDSANTYGNVVDRESEGEKRLAVLNYHGRRYLLSLMAELQCSLLREDKNEAVKRIEGQKPRIKRLVSATYAQTIEKAPETYLDPSLSNDGVTLNLMTDLYQQLQQAGVLTEPQIRDGNDLFEHLRKRIYRRKSVFRRLWRPAGRAKKDMAANLRYLIACTEDSNRVEAVRLLIDESIRSNFSFDEMRHKLAELRQNMAAQLSNLANNQVLAYTFA